MVPLVFLAGAAVVAGVGLKKGHDGVGSFREATRLGEQAERRQRIHVDLVDSARERLLGRLRLLQGHRAYILEHTFGRLLALLERLERRGKLHTVEGLSQGIPAAESVASFRPHKLAAADVTEGATKAVLAGHAAASVATVAVGQLAAASTGTAISALTGAAATNATLAWLGGGTIAAGGGGMALGAVVLSSVAAGPIVGVGGFVLAAQGAKAKTSALAYAAEVEEQIARMDALLALHHRAERRVNELGWLTEHLNARTWAALDGALEIADVFDEDDDAHVACVSAALRFATALGALARVQIFDEMGELLPASREIIDRYKMLLEET